MPTLPSTELRFAGHLYYLMQAKLAAQLGAVVPIRSIYRVDGTDDYYGTLESGASFKWPESGVLTVQFNHQQSRF